MPTIKQVDFINKKKFAKRVLDENFKIFKMHIVALDALLSKLSIYLDKKASIVFLLIKKIIIPDKHFNFADIFFEDKVLVLPE